MTLLLLPWQNHRHAVAFALEQYQHGCLGKLTYDHKVSDCKHAPCSFDLLNWTGKKTFLKIRS